MKKRKTKDPKDHARQRAKRNRAADREEVLHYVRVWHAIKTRCQENASGAYDGFKASGIPEAEFLSYDFDCRTCPMFMRCAFKQHFDDHPEGWHFAWRDRKDAS